MPAFRPDCSPPLSLVHLVGLMDTAQQGFAVFDQTDTLVYGNAFYRQLLSLEPDTWPTWKQMLRASYRDQTGSRITTADFETWLSSAASRRGKQPFRAFEADMHDGRWIQVSETTLENGWMLCVLTDISALTTDERTLREQRDMALRAALSDPLTGLSNRRHMQDALDELDQATRAGSVLVLLDLDNFKQINDSLGHHEGDAILQHFARLIQNRVRREDMVARWGGEEFLLVLRHIDIEDASALLDRLLEEVRCSTPLLHLPQLRYTCSAGLTTLGDGRSINDALKCADYALYQAKSSGRDRWIACTAAPGTKMSRAERAASGCATSGAGDRACTETSSPS